MVESEEKGVLADLLTDEDRTEAADAEKLNDEEVTEAVPAHPVDRGWAWMIMLGSILEMFLYGGLIRSYGVFFLQFQERFGSSASQTILVQTMFHVYMSLAGIFVMTYGMKHMTARTSICIGTLLSSASYIICAYTTRIEVAIVLLGVVNGASSAMLYLPILSYIALYFNKHRGLANSLYTSGASVGALTLGPLFNIMFEHYGYSGTMLITGGLLLNILVTGCIFRDPSFYNKDNRITGHRKDIELGKLQRETQIVDSRSTIEEATITRNVDPDSHKVSANHFENSNSSTKRLPIMYRSLSHPVSTDSCDGKHSQQTEYGSPDHTAPELIRVKKDNSVSHFHSANDVRTYGESDSRSLRKDRGLGNSAIALFPSTDIISGSVVIVNTEMHDSDNNKRFFSTSSDNVHKSDGTNCLSIANSRIGDFFATVFDKNILRDPVFVHFMCFVIFSAPGGFLTSIYFIPLATDIGFNSGQISILLFVIGFMDLSFKLSTGLVVDKKLLRPTTLISMTFAVGCILNNLTRVMSSYWQMLVFVIIQSSLGAAYLSLFAVILVEMLGIEKFKGALGFTNLAVGSSLGAFLPITGAIRDVTGSYHMTYHVSSVMLLIGSVLAFTLPLTQRRRHHKQTNQTVAQ